MRLTGKDTGQTLPRSSRLAVPTLTARRDARLVAVAVVLAQSVSASGGASNDAGKNVDGGLSRSARDSVLLLRAEALGDNPAFAAALSRLLDAMTAGGDVTEPLVAARRVLGNVRRADVLPWGSGGTP